MNKILVSVLAAAFSSTIYANNVPVASPSPATQNASPSVTQNSASAAKVASNSVPVAVSAQAAAPIPASAPEAQAPAPTAAPISASPASPAAPAQPVVQAQAKAAVVQQPVPAKVEAKVSPSAVNPAPTSNKVVLAAAEPASAPSTTAPEASAQNPSATNPVVNAVMAGVPGVSPEQQKQIESVVHNYLIKNPEVIIEAIQALQQKQVDQAQKAIQKTQEVAPKFADALFHQTNDPFIGNANGKVVIVDFFDYQCPHCSKMTPILETLTKGNADLKVVFKEFPIRGPVSEFAAKSALAAKNQGKYFEFHKALMLLATKPDPLTEDAVIKTAQSVGLNVAKLKTDMKTDAIAQQIKNNFKLGQDLQLLGTPAFFIAKANIQKDAKPANINFIPGQTDQGQLQTILDKEKK